jgi:hypothetical protein
VQVPVANVLPQGIFTLPVAASTLCGMTKPRPIHERPVYRLRWQNFRALIGSDRGAITDAAYRLQKSQGQVSHFGGERPIKNIGDDIADEIEKAWGKGHGWLDQSHNSSGEGTVNEHAQGVGDVSQSAELDALMMAEAEKWVRFEEGAGAVFQPVRRAQRLIDLYRMVGADGGSLTPEHAEDIINAARKRHDAGAVESGRNAKAGHRNGGAR